MKFQFSPQIFRCLNLVLTNNFDQTMLKSTSRVNLWFFEIFYFLHVSLYNCVTCHTLTRVTTMKWHM